MFVRTFSTFQSTNMSTVFVPHLVSLELDKWPRVYVPPLNIIWDFYRVPNVNYQHSLHDSRNISI